MRSIVRLRTHSCTALCNANKMSAKSAVDLDVLLQNFSTWQDSMSNLLKENSRLSNELKSSNKQSCLHQEAAQNESNDSAQLRATIDTLHATLEKRCNSDEENKRLKAQIEEMTMSAKHLEQRHKEQMGEALENLETVQRAHKREVSEIQENTKQQMQKDIKVLERTVQERNVEIRRLQKENAELERAKHTEVVKLRLEYDAKLLKLQKQNTRAQSAQSSSVNNEIFRKKLQHAKAESDREIATLKRKVYELETQVQRQGQANTLTNKRRRIN